MKRTNNPLIFAISAPIPAHIHITSDFSVALLFPLSIKSGRRTLLCNIISGYFNETVWNLLLLLIRKDKQWNLGLIETNGIISDDLSRTRTSWRNQYWYLRPFDSCDTSLSESALTLLQILIRKHYFNITLSRVYFLLKRNNRYPELQFMQQESGPTHTCILIPSLLQS